MPSALLFLYAESPVHAGGDASLGALDLPIQRESSTDLPVIWGQSLKGALRSYVRGRDPRWVAKVFGTAPPGSDEEAAAQEAAAQEAAAPDPATPRAAGSEPAGSETAGSGGRSRPGGSRSSMAPGTLSVGDAQLVAFPVPTIRRTFAWVTAPLALGRLTRKAALAGLAGGAAVPSTVPAPGDDVVFAADAGWTGTTLVGPFVTRPTVDAQAAEWAGWVASHGVPGAPVPASFAEKMRSDLLTVPDDALPAITRECAEITPRVQLKADEKTVEHGPFYSEFLPVETLLVSLLECSSQAHLDELRGLLHGRVLRLGGNETIGKGLLWCRFVDARDNAGSSVPPQAEVQVEATPNRPVLAGRRG